MRLLVAPTRGAEISTHLCPNSYCTHQEEGRAGGRGKVTRLAGKEREEGSLPPLLTIVDSELTNVDSELINVDSELTNVDSELSNVDSELTNVDSEQYVATDQFSLT